MSEDESDRSTEETADRGVPLADLVERVGERTDSAARDLIEGEFVEMPVPPQEPDTVWADVEIGPVPSGRVGVDGSGGSAIVLKREYCERCGHFAPPPEPQCTHDGTSIQEFVDRRHVRVENCPFVGDDSATAGPEARESDGRNR